MAISLHANGSDIVAGTGEVVTPGPFFPVTLEEAQKLPYFVNYGPTTADGIYETSYGTAQWFRDGNGHARLINLFVKSQGSGGAWDFKRALLAAASGGQTELAKIPALQKVADVVAPGAVKQVLAAGGDVLNDKVSPAPRDEAGRRAAATFEKLGMLTGPAPSTDVPPPISKPAPPPVFALPLVAWAGVAGLVFWLAVKR